MDLELTEDQAELRSIARDLLRRRGDLGPARELLEGRGEAPTLYAEMMELGWPAVGLEEDDPFGIPGLCVLAEQIGAHVAPAPLVDGAVIARLAVGASGPVAEAASAGETAASLCVVEEDTGWDPAQVAAVAEGGRITATKLNVHHGAAAQILAVLAQVNGEPAALLVASDADGCRVDPSPSLDASAAATTVELEGVGFEPGDVVTGSALRGALAVGAVATAAESVGAAGRSLDMAVEYALERRQFGRPIGSFQALQHRLAEMYVLRETTWSTVLYAAAALDDGLDDAEQAVSIAKAYASRATREIVHGALQVLGGIGFTWEHDVHLLQRRVLECERRFGDAIDHERRLSAALAPVRA